MIKQTDCVILLKNCCNECLWDVIQILHYFKKRNVLKYIDHHTVNYDFKLFCSFIMLLWGVEKMGKAVKISLKIIWWNEMIF